METSLIKNSRSYVLSIDDDPDFNSLLQVMLNKLSVDVVTTDAPESFFKNFTQLRPKLCLVDIHLGKNYNAGFELIKLLRKENYSDLPIIVISSVKNKEDISRALDLGANDYLTKPIEKVLLAEKVRQFIEIDHTAYDPFKLFSVPDRFSDIEISFQLELIKIGVDKVSFKSLAYLAPQTIINLDESSFSSFGHMGNGKIQVQVLQNKKWEKEGHFEVLCRICQGERESQLKSNLRRWLFWSQQPHVL